MEEFLPGLVKVMEERLGRFGRPLTTIVVVSIALGTIAWGLRLFWDNAVSPISQFIQTILEVQPITSEELVKQIVKPIVIYIIFLIGVIITGQIVIKKKVGSPAVKTLSEAKELLSKPKFPLIVCSQGEANFSAKCSQ